MKVDINTAFIFKALSAIISVGTLLWLLAGKLNDAEVERAEIKIQLNMLMEERMVKLKQGELYDRFNRILNRTDESNYSIDRYIEPKDEPKPSEKK